MTDAGKVSESLKNFARDVDYADLELRVLANMMDTSPMIISADGTITKKRTPEEKQRQLLEMYSGRQVPKQCTFATKELSDSHIKTRLYKALGVSEHINGETVQNEVMMSELAPMPFPSNRQRHEYYERQAQGIEAGHTINGLRLDTEDRQNMPACHLNAQAALPYDDKYDAEALAIKENRIVLKSKLKSLGSGDRKCYEMKGLREFEVMDTPQHKLFFWWDKS